jgi:hypothetical protein
VSSIFNSAVVFSPEAVPPSSWALAQVDLPRAQSLRASHSVLDSCGCFLDGESSISEVVSTSCNFSDLLRVFASVSWSHLELPI